MSDIIPIEREKLIELLKRVFEQGNSGAIGEVLFDKLINDLIHNGYKLPKPNFPKGGVDFGKPGEDQRSAFIYNKSTEEHIIAKDIKLADLKNYLKTINKSNDMESFPHKSWIDPFSPTIVTDKQIKFHGIKQIKRTTFRYWFDDKGIHVACLQPKDWDYVKYLSTENGVDLFKAWDHGKYYNGVMYQGIKGDDIN